MKYEEDIATDLSAKYRVSESTVRLWKTNDEIPDYYLSTLPIRIHGMDLRETRRFLGYTSQMACLMLKKNGLEVSRVSLSQWERGKAKIRKKNKELLVKIYKKLVKNKKKLLGL